ncbi:MAG: hypothetical protein GQ570_11615 [Helicobacteraceae bacterium]|nr:hypothetical protein [Helicobacteraceae bacterium]
MKKYLEKDLEDDVSEFLQTKYKKVLYRFDAVAGLKLSIGQANRIKKLHGVNNRGFVDLTIFESNRYYHALMIELKITTPYLKDGKTLKKDKHLKEQSDYHQKLRDKGYAVYFATGLKECIEIIDEYMS